MIAITGTISETKWRSMGQRDTAMGIHPSDYCATPPWERCAVYLSGVFFFFSPCCFICIFLSLPPRRHKSCPLKKKKKKGRGRAGVYVRRRSGFYWKSPRLREKKREKDGSNVTDFDPSERMSGRLSFFFSAPQSTDVFKRNICCRTNEITVSLARSHGGYEWHR